MKQKIALLILGFSIILLNSSCDKETNIKKNKTAKVVKKNENEESYSVQCEKDKIQSEIDIKGKKYIVVNNSYIKVEENLKKLLSGEENWCTTNISNLSKIFKGKKIDIEIKDWDLSNVTSTSSMFKNAISFNKDIGDWNVMSVVNMESMFKNAKKFNQDISEWDVSSVNNMKEMFKFAESFNNDSYPIEWGEATSKVADMERMFEGAKAFDQDIANWNISSVNTMKAMLKGALQFNNETKYLDWENSTEDVNDMAEMFKNSKKFNQDISKWNVSNVVTMESMFSNSNNFNNNGNKLMWGKKVAKVVTMEGMFEKTKKFNQDISGWTISAVKNIKNMFADSIDFDNKNREIKLMETVSVNNMEGLFKNSKKFDQDISDWNVSNVVTMESMFEGAKSFNNASNSIDWTDVNNVTTMAKMFKDTEVFNQDIKEWELDKIQNLESMFEGARAFKSKISLKIETAEKELVMTNIFKNAVALDCSNINGDLLKKHCSKRKT